MVILSIFSPKTYSRRCEAYCEEARSFIQVHYVRERGSDRYAFNSLKIKSDPQRESCKKWYEEHGNPDNFGEIATLYLTQKKKKMTNICKSYKLETRVFSSEYKRNVKKWEALAVCLGLNLNIAESRALLKTEDYALTNSSDTDLAIRYCIEHKIFSLNDVNYVLKKVCNKSLEQI